MAYTELHTAALRLVHVSRPSDRDMDYLTREFHLAPTDVEALLGVNNATNIIQTDAYRRLTLAWPTPTRRGIAVSDVHLIVADHWVIVVDHGDFPAAADVVNELQTMPSERLWQDDAMMIVYELLRRAIRGLLRFDHDLPANHLIALNQARHQLAETLKAFAIAGSASPEVTKGFAFLAFSLHHQNPAGARPPAALPTRLPFSARRYAAASAAVAFATLLVVSRSL